jgi:hypothetical protein
LTVAGDAAGTELDEVHIVNPYTISRHLMLTVSNRDASWKVALRANNPNPGSLLPSTSSSSRNTGLGKHLVVGVSHWPSR